MADLPCASEASPVDCRLSTADCERSACSLPKCPQGASAGVERPTLPRCRASSPAVLPPPSSVIRHPSSPIGVAFSGGVDSAVCVRLLQREGYAVQAWHMLTCSAEPAPGVVELAAALGVPLHLLDLREAFERAVVAPFFDAYAAGQTPNPCAWCNPRLKFGLLQRAIGGPMATGHYVALDREPLSGRLTLRCATDAAKDQSYFLYALPPDLLPHLRFPLAGMTRAQVVALARDWRLPIPEAKLAAGSQDICFLPNGDYRPELRRRHPETATPGPILDLAGRRLGTHTGLANYTRGQRKGLGIATGARAFVIALDRVANTLTLGPREALLRTTFAVRDPHWLIPPTFPLACQAVTRYHHPPFDCTLSADLTVHPASPQALLTPGQACVFYRGPYLLGGATIAEESR